VAAGLACAQWWSHWSWLEPSVFSLGQPRPLIVEAAPAAPRYPCLGMQIQSTSFSQVDTNMFCESR